MGRRPVEGWWAVGWVVRVRWCFESIVDDERLTRAVSVGSLAAAGVSAVLGQGPEIQEQTCLLNSAVQPSHAQQSKRRDDVKE